ncbi:MAG: DUF308 domain-containing protein [Geminicoccaceae bacterium]
MIEVILLLVGGDYLQRRWRLLVVLGIVWLVAGTILGIDALDGRLTFPLESFALLVLLECLVALSLARSGLSLAPRLRLLQAVALAVVAILILSPRDVGDVLIAFGLAAAFAVDGLTRMVTAWYVRFPGWQVTFGGGALLLLLAVTLVVPWQPGYVDAIPYCIGLGLVGAGLGLLRAGLGLRRWPPGSAIAPHLVHARSGGDALQLPPVPPTPPGRRPLIVRVWTALGTADHPVLHRHLVLDRYIAAVDGQGTISTGHSALELPPDLYISHYPAVEIDHSPTEFQHLFRATPDNDVPGRFQPSYAVESAEWCPANRHVAFRRFNPARLRAFWDAYRRDTTYNLTWRNCSSTVALALDCAIEGNLARHGVGPYLLLRVLLTPELWIAAQLRHRARTMAWTPGILLDYAMAMRALQDPPASGLLALIRLPFRAWRRH